MQLHPLTLAEPTRRPRPAQVLEVGLGLALVAEARIPRQARARVPLEHHGEHPDALRVGLPRGRARGAPPSPNTHDGHTPKAPMTPMGEHHHHHLATVPASSPSTTTPRRAAPRRPPRGAPARHPDRRARPPHPPVDRAPGRGGAAPPRASRRPRPRRAPPPPPPPPRRTAARPRAPPRPGWPPPRPALEERRRAGAAEGGRSKAIAASGMPVPEAAPASDEGGRAPSSGMAVPELGERDIKPDDEGGRAKNRAAKAAGFGSRKA